MENLTQWIIRSFIYREITRNQSNVPGNSSSQKFSRH